MEAQAASDVLLAALGALMFGVALGWLVWGGPKRKAPAAEAHGDPHGIDAAPAAATSSTNLPEQLEAAERELKSARVLFEEKDDDPAYADDLSAVQSALSSANERLKSVLSAVKKRAADR